MSVPLSKVVAALPATTPFQPPEALERHFGKRFELRLGANESSFGPSPLAKAAIEEGIGEVQNYGDATLFELKNVLASHLGCRPEQVVVGPGIDGLLGHLARVFLNPGDCAVTSLGSYPTLEYAVRSVGGRVETVPYRDDAPDLEALASRAREVSAKIVYLANPDNPSGYHFPADQVSEFVAAVPEDTAIILDEAYCEFAEAAVPADAFLGDPRVVRLRTFSKVHGLAGIRVGYVFGDADTVSPIDRIRMHFEVNILGQRAALASLADLGHSVAVARVTREGREFYSELASSVGMKALPSQTNFVAIDTGSHECAVRIMNELAVRSVFIRMPWAEPLNRCIRVTVGSSEEQARFAEIFRGVVVGGV